MGRIPTTGMCAPFRRESDGVFVIKMVRAARRTLTLQSERLAARPRIASVFFFLATAITLLATLSWFQRNQADDARSSQVLLNKITVVTREINNLTLTALQEQHLTPQAESEMRVARHSLPNAVLAAHLHAYHTPALERVWPALDDYLVSTGRQWVLIQTGSFDDAKQVEFQYVSPQYDLMQHQVQVAIEAEDKWAQGVALRARNELLAAMILAAAAILTLFLRLQRQEHLGQLQETERKALRKSEERFRALTEQSADVIFITDLAGRIQYASPSVEAVLSLHCDCLAGTNLIEVIHPDDFAKVVGTESHSIGNGENPILDLRLRHADGSWRYFECVVRNLIKNQNIGGIVYNARDITERKRAQEELLFNATHDTLTGLPNRAFFLGRLQSVVDRIKKYPSQAAAVLFIDIDDFKYVNDCYGHATGDLLLKEVSNKLRHACGATSPSPGWAETSLRC